MALLHGLHEHHAAMHIVVVVLQGHADRFADRFQAGKMNDGLNGMLC